MATRKKAKGKTARKKTPVTKAAARRKATTVRETKTNRKKVAKKAPVRRALPKKARQTTKPTVKSTPVSRPAKPEAIRPTPSLPAQPVPSEERIGVVTHYYSHPSVATIRLESGTLRIGDMVHIRGHTTDFSQKVRKIELKIAARVQHQDSDSVSLRNTVLAERAGKAAVADDNLRSPSRMATPCGLI